MSRHHPCPAALRLLAALAALGLLAHCGPSVDGLATSCEVASGGPCTTFAVPSVCPTIQSGLDVAQDCDTVLVAPGVYVEQLLFPLREVTLTSDPVDGGDQLVDYGGDFVDLEGDTVSFEARSQVLRRTLDTIIDVGSIPETVDGTPTVDFEPGTTRATIIDGFTLQYLPHTDHTIPGHAHTIECRGSSPTIRNNLIRFNGTTGVGIHATFVETDDEGRVQDWRMSNVEFYAGPLVENNISHHNEGMGLGNNHYSEAELYDNEVFSNQASEFDHPAAGIGSRHGARTTIEGNIVWGNAWGGILQSQGDLQGEHPIDRRTRTVVRFNEVYGNGIWGPPDRLAGIGVDGAGLVDLPVIVEGNLSYDSMSAGIGTINDLAGPEYAGDDTFVEIRDNVVHDTIMAGITCAGGALGTNHCTIERNVVHRAGTIGIVFGGQDLTVGATGTVTHNTVAFSGTAGFRSYEGQVDVRNNIFFGNTGAGMVHPAGAHDHNLVSGNNNQDPDCGGEPWCVNPQYAPGSGGQPAGTGDIWMDPLFTDAAGGDFTLTTSSPAIDGGAMLGGDEYSGAAPDMGAIERGAEEGS